MSADPANFTGTCPQTIHFSAAIAANAPGTLTYQWERSDGVRSPVQSISFGSAGTQTATASWKLAASYSGWIRLNILTPNATTSNQAKFTLNCK